MFKHVTEGTVLFLVLPKRSMKSFPSSLVKAVYELEGMQHMHELNSTKVLLHCLENTMIRYCLHRNILEDQDSGCFGLEEVC